PTIYTALPHHWHQLLAPAMMKDHFRAYFEPHGRSQKEVLLAAVAYFLACLMYNAYPLPQQMSGTRRALAYTGELVNRGYCPIVFPEGLRTSDGTLQKFRPGIGMMTIRLRVPVVPIQLSGLYEIYSLHDSWPRLGPRFYRRAAVIQYAYQLRRSCASIGGDLSAWVLGRVFEIKRADRNSPSSHPPLQFIETFYRAGGSNRIFCKPFSSAYSRLSSQMYSSNW